MQSPLFLLIVGFTWFLYAIKTLRFVVAVLEEPQSGFLYILSSLGPGRLFRWCWLIQALLLFPVWGYSLVVTGVGIHRGDYVIGLAVQIYFGALCWLSALVYRYKLTRPGHRAWMAKTTKRVRRLPYWWILLRQLLQEEKALLAGLKLFGCSILYLLLRDDTDLRMPLLFFYLAILGHGALLYRCRLWEDTRLSFYRTLPVSLPARFGQYCACYFLLLLPEISVLIRLTPSPVAFRDVLTFILTGYGLLLLLNSLLITAHYTSRQFLQLCLCIFGILYCCVLGKCLLALSGLLLVTATILFFRGYARYEKRA
ncbi:MAG: hypothetical protein JST68_00935 [Bacteroidetes bacterium]|nr:hypothetical protein [Bacteroidota bacterium]